MHNNIYALHREAQALLRNLRFADLKRYIANLMPRGLGAYVDSLFAHCRARMTNETMEHGIRGAFK
jgi:hypothetical protein